MISYSPETNNNSLHFQLLLLNLFNGKKQVVVHRANFYSLRGVFITGYCTKLLMNRFAVQSLLASLDLCTYSKSFCLEVARFSELECSHLLKVMGCTVGGLYFPAMGSGILWRI